MDLATGDRRDNFGASSSSKTSRLHLTDPAVLLLKASIVNPITQPSTTTTAAARQSIDSLINSSKPTATPASPITNLNTMKTYSVSDSDINYKFLEEIEEAQGSSAYINRSGTINFGVVLAGIHAVICKEHHLKVCELVMNIIEVFFGLNMISTSKELIDNEIFQLIMDIILR